MQKDVPSKESTSEASKMDFFWRKSISEKSKMILKGKKCIPDAQEMRFRGGNTMIKLLVMSIWWQKTTFDKVFYNILLNSKNLRLKYIFICGVLK